MFTSNSEQQLPILLLFPLLLREHDRETMLWFKIFLSSCWEFLILNNGVWYIVCTHMACPKSFITLVSSIYIFHIYLSGSTAMLQCIWNRGHLYCLVSKWQLRWLTQAQSKHWHVQLWWQLCVHNIFITEGKYTRTFCLLKAWSLSWSLSFRGRK